MVRVVSKEISEIKLSEKGYWFHQEEPFENEKIIFFFHRAIQKDDKGQYYLYNQFEDKQENVYFDVEDTAYFIWDIEFDEQKKTYTITLNTGVKETLDLRSLNEDYRGVMYCKVLDGDRARFSPRTLMELSKHAIMDDDCIYIDRTGEKIVISKI
ncbi:MAG: DUF1285 domain-containing protein [Proteobacteria bacterium]|nr:DUF1285 domain-containing protein [Pseudomonadota bacterium]